MLYVHCAAQYFIDVVYQSITTFMKNSFEFIWKFRLCVVTLRCEHQLPPLMFSEDIESFLVTVCGSPWRGLLLKKL